MNPKVKTFINGILPLLIAFPLLWWIMGSSESAFMYIGGLIVGKFYWDSVG